VNELNSEEIKPRGNYWVGKLRTVWQKLIHEDTTPNNIAFGFALGIFTAFFPAPVIDTLIALAIAHLVKANRAACLIGNNLILLVFPIMPFLFGFEYFIGKKILNQPLTLSLPQDWTFWMLLRNQGPNYYAIAIGAVVLAIPGTIISFFVVKTAAAKWQARKLHHSIDL
jgi:uncharacterized protein